MRKIIDFFKRLWRLITGQEVRPYIESEKPASKKKVLIDINYDFDIDYVDVYDTIVNCKTIKGLQKECKKYNITISTDIKQISGDKTLKLKSKYLYELINVYSKGVAEKYKQAVTAKLQEIKPLSDRRIKELRLQGLKYDPDIDYVDIYNSLINCRTPEGMQKECKERGIMISTDVRNISPDKTVQLKCEELLSLLKLFGQGASEPFKKALETKIEEFELLKNQRIAELQAQGICCPKCFSKQKKYYTGLIDIKSHDGFYSPLGGGVAVGGDGHTEFQFHYTKCFKCGHWEMFEYRSVPHWWEDLFDIDCPFHSGSIIQKYIDGKIPGERYISYEVLRW